MLKMLSSFVFFLILLQVSVGDLIVEIRDGKVEGTSFNTPSGKTFYAWRGIPYGKPPVGKLRYMAPEKAEPWEGVLDGSKHASPCIGFRSSSILDGQSEDCLYINVYSPVAVGSETNITTQLNVMLWIFGGGFTMGSGDFDIYDPSPLLDDDVMVVTFNYRLGPLGLLSTEDETVLGNAALKDQLLALQWTRDNIARFGGNPNSVTIFGESAGAVSVGYHIVSPKSKGLFKGAIMESGSAVSPVLSKNPRQTAYGLAKFIDSSISDESTTQEVVDVLQAADPQTIVSATLSSRSSFAGVIEVESESSFLSEPIYEQLESGNFSRIPTIIGYNSLEALFSMNDMDSLIKEAQLADSDRERLVPNIPLKDNVSKNDIGEEIHEEYIGKDGLFVEDLATYLEFLSSEMNRAVTKHALLQSKYAPVYLYQFSFYGTTSHNNLNVTGVKGGVGHSQELGYLFNFSDTDPLQTDADFLARRRLVKLWTNFAKTSDPTPDDDSQELLENVKWVPVEINNVQYIDIDETLQVKQRDPSKANFWDYIWTKYSFRPYNTF